MGKMHTRSFLVCLTIESILFGDDLYFEIVEKVLEMTELYVLISLVQSCKYSDEVLYFRQ